MIWVGDLLETNLFLAHATGERWVLSKIACFKSVPSRGVPGKAQDASHTPLPLLSPHTSSPRCGANALRHRPALVCNLNAPMRPRAGVCGPFATLCGRWRGADNESLTCRSGCSSPVESSSECDGRTSEPANEPAARGLRRSLPEQDPERVQRPRWEAEGRGRRGEMPLGEDCPGRSSPGRPRPSSPRHGGVV